MTASSTPNMSNILKKNEKKSIKPFSLRIKSTLKESNISLNDMHASILLQIPPWIFELKELPKTKSHPINYQEKFHNILQHHPDHLYIFMDGSKDNDKTACAAILNKTIIKKAFLMESSVFTEEAWAIDLAFNIIAKSKHKKFIIFSGLLSVLLSLSNKRLENTLIIKVLSRLDSMSNSKKIIICWIPRYMEVKGNEKADSAAKLA